MNSYDGSSLVEHTLFGTEDLVQRAIKEIRAVSERSNICLRFSGGKDSVVIKRLLDMAEVPKHRNAWVLHDHILVFSLDELQQFRRVDRCLTKPDRVRHIIKKGFPPTRICRYCCQEFKERNVCGRGNGIVTVTGVRKAESPRRKSRSKYETCQADKGVNFFHPIVNWTDEQVWDFIRAEKIPYCRLYDEGMARIGCVGCPLASSEKIVAEFKRWPQFEKAYLWAFEKMLEGRSFDKWKNKYDVMDWYIYGAEKDYAALADGSQISLFSEDYFDQFDAGEDAYPFSADDARRIISRELARAPLGKGVWQWKGSKSC